MKIKLLSLITLSAFFLGCGDSNNKIVSEATDSPGSVSIVGVPQVGEQVTASVSDPNGTFFNALGAQIKSIVWSADGALIAGAIEPQYTLTAAEVGAAITVMVEYVDNAGFLGVVTSAPTAPVTSGPAPTSEVINDSFADADRTRTGALDADWWSSSQTSGSNVQISAGALTLVTGSSGRGMHATFTPQTLDVGDSITVTYSFTTPTTIGNTTGTSFKIALMDLDDPGLAADQSSSSSSVNPLYVGQPGYFTAFDVSSVGGGSQDTDFRKHDVSAGNGRFLGTTSEWSGISSSSDAGYAFMPNQDYIGVFSITRTGADSVDLFSSMSLAGGALLDSHATSDNSAIANNFGMLGFWVNSNTFGASNNAGDPDNGLIFTNVLVESN